MTARDIVADHRAVAEVLDSARRYGLPMPHSVHVTDHSIPTFQVDSAKAWHEWAEYLENPAFELARAGSQDHLWVFASDHDCEVKVIAIVPAGEGEQHIPVVTA